MVKVVPPGEVLDFFCFSSKAAATPTIKTMHPLDPLDIHLHRQLQPLHTECIIIHYVSLDVCIGRVQREFFVSNKVNIT